MDVGHVLASWIHTLAFVIAWGYYGILGRIVIPGLGDLDSERATRTLASIERRALPLVLLSIGLFVVTGVYLLVVDDRYTGLGNVLASPWTSLLTLKHVLVAALIGLGVLIDYLIRTAGEPVDDLARRGRIRQVRLAAEGATALGALIVLTTTIAQAS
jgi:uncharacterized membrane protein